MSYDESLAARVRKLLSRRRGFTEEKMFGGVGFLRQGKMCVGVWKEFLIVRVGPDAYNAALAESFVKKFDITGRAMTGWVMVLADGVAADDDLQAWLERAQRFVASLADG